MREELVREDLLKYIKENILKFYDLNGEAHGLEHVMYVIKRSFEIAELYENINYDILYTVAAFHDIGDHIDRENHELVSAKWMMNDKNLDKFFSLEQKQIIKEAIEDHRSSKEGDPRNLYGKILVSADKNIEIDVFFKRCVLFGLEHNPDYTDEQQIERVYNHAVKKFGKNGYAVSKYYAEDGKYQKYLNELQELIENREEFDKYTRNALTKYKK